MEENKEFVSFEKYEELFGRDYLGLFFNVKTGESHIISPLEMHGASVLHIVGLLLRTISGLIGGMLTSEGIGHLVKIRVNQIGIPSEWLANNDGGETTNEEKRE